MKNLKRIKERAVQRKVLRLKYKLGKTEEKLSKAITALINAKTWGNERNIRRAARKVNDLQWKRKQIMFHLNVLMKDIVHDFCYAIRRLYEDCGPRTNKKWTVPNVKGSYLLIGDEFTALNLGGDIVSTEQVQDPIEVAMKSMTSPVDDERLKKALLKTGAVYSLEQNMYFQAKILFPNGEEATRVVSFIRNDVLWQGQSQRPPLFEGVLELIGEEPRAKRPSKFNKIVAGTLAKEPKYQGQIYSHDEMTHLKIKLAWAIEKEAYEEAAKLRDQINALEKKGKNEKI